MTIIGTADEASSQASSAPRWRLPPEWAPQAGVWLSWPATAGVSFPLGFDGVQEAFAGFIAAVSRYETVFLLVPSESEEANARDKLRSAAGAEMERIRYFHIPTNEPWLRDSAPLFVVGDAGRAAVNWRFNAWGAKYEPYELDAEVGGKIAGTRDIPMFEPDWVLEGGAVEVNGVGDLLTTRSCLLDANRNIGMTEERMEAALRRYLGVARVHWLEGELEGDDTDGHIDQLARFVNDQTIVTSAPGPTDSNRASFRALKDQLSSLRGKDGRGFEIETVPLPSPIIRDGQRMPASYANFLIVNDAVLVPIFGCPEDRIALETFDRLFQNRRIEGVDCAKLIEGLGALHCLSMQETAEPESKPHKGRSDCQASGTSLP